MSGPSRTGACAPAAVFCPSTAFKGFRIGGRIKGTLGDIDPLNKVTLKRARSRVQKGYPLRGLPNTTPYRSVLTRYYDSCSGIYTVKVPFKGSIRVPLVDLLRDLFFMFGRGISVLKPSIPP